jgi:uncharacterized protein YecE (DUF72 family)
MSVIRIGTCSWKYDSWEGLVYSGGNKSNYLNQYSERFNTVEIDQWFWSLFGEKKVSLPNPKVIDDYINSVPEDFKFSIKLPNSISLTHFYNNKKGDPLKSNPYFLSKDLYAQVIDIFGEFGDKLGPLMLQFEYLNKQKMNSQMDFQIRFKSFLNSIKNKSNLALEIRNPNYLNQSFFEFLNENEIIPVLLQGYYMPSIVQTYEKFSQHFEKTVVIRLHGPDRKGIEKITGGDWSKVVAPKDDELRNIIEIIKDLLNKQIEVYLNINNHYEGCAPITIQKIKDQLGVN